MSTTSPNTIWTPDFFWEAPPETAEYIDRYAQLTEVQRFSADHLNDPYFTQVEEAQYKQRDSAIRSFGGFVIAQIAVDGQRAPLRPHEAERQEVRYEGLADNSQMLTTRLDRWLRTLPGQDWSSQPKLLTYEEQLARDQHESRHTGRVTEHLAEIAIFTDSREAYVWPKDSEFPKRWPLVRVMARTNGISIGVTYADYEHGQPLSLPPTHARVNQLRTFLEQFSSGVPLGKDQ